MIQLVPHKATVTMATSICVLSSLQISRTNIELMDQTGCVLVPWPLSNCLYCCEWSSCLVFMFLESLQYLQREKCYNASSYGSFSSNVKTIFCERGRRWVCRCVCVGIGHGQRCPLISLLSTSLLLSLALLERTGFGSILVWCMCVTTTERGRIVLYVL